MSDIFTGNGLIGNTGAIKQEFAQKVAESYTVLEELGAVMPLERTIQNLPNTINSLRVQ